MTTYYMIVKVTTIKDKASKAKESTTNKFKDTRDKYSSTPMAKTKFAEGGYVPDARNAPPPPSRSSVSSSSRASFEAYHSPPPPPPVSLGTKPSAFHSQAPQSAAKPPPPPRRAVAAGTKVEDIDWINLSEEDKQEFFNWLDEFFARFLNMKGARETAKLPSENVGRPVEEPVPPARESKAVPPVTRTSGPPVR